MTNGLAVRPCTAHDLAVLLASADDNHVAKQHHREQWNLQAAGLGTYIVAWRGNEPVGRCTVLASSKYQAVTDVLGSIPEINALETFTQGQGIGTELIFAAEGVAREAGATALGIAVELENDGALRLYERLGYSDWGRGHVEDVWFEHDEHGEPTREHHDPCSYLTKTLSEPRTS